MTPILTALKEILEIADKATPGSWKTPYGEAKLPFQQALEVGISHDHPIELSDFQFVIHSRSTLPRVTKALIKAVELINDFCECWDTKPGDDEDAPYTVQCLNCKTLDEISAIIAGKGE